MQLSLLDDELPLAAPSKRTKSKASKKPPVISVPEPTEQLAIAPVIENPPVKDEAAFKNISEAANLLEVPQHVLRFWESRFTQIKPLKMRGGRRYYRPEDMEILTTIKNLLYKQGYTIEGAKKAFALLRGKKKAPAAPVQKRALTDKKRKEIAAIREELIGLCMTLQQAM